MPTLSDQDKETRLFKDSGFAESILNGMRQTFILGMSKTRLEDAQSK
jgi:hypothetical protein